MKVLWELWCRSCGTHVYDSSDPAGPGGPIEAKPLRSVGDWPAPRVGDKAVCPVCGAWIGDVEFRRK